MGKTRSGAAAVCLSLVLFATLGCQPEVREFPVQGQIEGILEDGQVLLIKHEEIPGYMQAMTMQFKVEDPSQTPALDIGDAVGFTLVTDGDASYIRAISKR